MALIAATVVGVVAPSPIVPAAGAATPIEGFVDEPVLGGLSLPTSISFGTDGSVFVAEKAGRIKRFDDVSDTTPTVVLDIGPKVSAFGDRGLMGFQLSPQFPTDPTAFIIYGARGKMGETIPSGVTCTSDPCIESGMLSRLEWDGTAFTEHQMLHDWCQIYFSHSVDDVAVLGDGSVMASAGDSAFTGFFDNRCPGEPTGESGSLRPQDIRTVGDPIGYTGSVIRVDAQGNPVRGPTAEDRIVAAGMRNPFRITHSTQTGLVFVADVGEDRTESIDVLVPGQFSNHGWPCYEQSLPGPGAFTPICDALPYSETKPAFFTYEHSAVDVASDDAGRCPPTTSGNSISGLTHYRGSGPSAYPAAFRNGLFFSDYARRCIWYLEAGEDGMPDPAKARHFARAVTGIVDLEEGPDGSLYYLDVTGTTARRLRHTGAGTGNLPPVIVAAGADPSSGAAPLLTTLTATATDPEAAPLTYAWDLDGNGSFETPGSSVAATYGNPGTFTPTVRVSDAVGGSVTRSVTVTVTGSDSIAITAPGNWSVGDLVNLGAAIEPAPPPGVTWSFSWDVDLRHCTAGCHAHELVTGSGPAPQFAAPDHEYPTTIEVGVTAVSSTGASLTATRRLDPATVVVTATTDPPGGVIVDSRGDHVTPHTVTVIRNSAVSLSVPVTQDIGGRPMAFTGWSTGSTARTISFQPLSNTSVAANYSASGPGTTTSTTSSTSTSTSTTAPPPPACPTRLEAEAAALAGVQVDVNWPSHSGTGVIGWFDTVGDAVTWTVDVPTTGPYPLTWQYATTQNGWARTVEVDGVAVGRVNAGSTGGWNRYATTTPLSVSLTAGRHTIRLAYRSADAQFINVDYLEVGCAGTGSSTTTAPTTTAPMTTTSTTTSTTTTSTPPTTVPTGTTTTSTTSTSAATTTTTTTTAPPTTTTTTAPTTCSPTRHEAETAALTGVQVDRNWPPHSGTGVVGWFDSVGDAITWTVTVPATGTYPLSWRYATTQSGWARTIELDGVAVGRVDAGSTGAWNTYFSTTPTTVTLTAGTHQIRLAYRTGDTQFINVDYLELGCSGAGAGTTTTTTSPTTVATTTTVPMTTTAPTTTGPTTTTPGGTCPRRLEAENAALTGVRVDTQWPPHSGTGVVGWFETIGDAITWTVTVPQSGSYPMAWRYATIQNGWARTIEVDGTQVGRFTGSSTGAWNRYADTPPISVTLSAGTHQVRMAYRSGDARNLNVDYLQLGCRAVS